MRPEWKPYANNYPVLKQITYRVASASQLNADSLTEDQALSLLTNGMAKRDTAHKGKSCALWTSCSLDRSLSLVGQIKAAIAAGSTAIYT